MGVIRHVDAGYAEADACAATHGIVIPTRSGTPV
jgi:urocanate hydratase